MTAREENIPLLKWIQDDVPSRGDEKYFLKSFDVGPRDKSGFQIAIKGGDYGSSVPDIMLDNIADYETLTIELFQYPPMDEEDLKPSELEVKGYKFILNWQVAPSPIHPQEDDRFKEREWAKHFVKGPAAVFTHISYAQVSPDIICQIIRDCYSIFNMKAFW